MFRPIRLFAYRLAQDPGWAWSPKDHEGVLHALPLSVQLLGSQIHYISVSVKWPPGLQPTFSVSRSSIRSNADRYDPDSAKRNSREAYTGRETLARINRTEPEWDCCCVAFPWEVRMPVSF